MAYILEIENKDQVNNFFFSNLEILKSKRFCLCVGNQKEKALQSFSTIHQVPVSSKQYFTGLFLERCSCIFITLHCYEVKQNAIVTFEANEIPFVRGSNFQQILNTFVLDFKEVNVVSIL